MQQNLQGSISNSLVSPTQQVLRIQYQTCTHLFQTQPNLFIESLKNSFQSGEPNTCFEAVRIVTKLLKGGFSKRISLSRSLLKSIIKYFNYLFRELTGQSQRRTELLQNTIVSILSLFAQILHQNNKCRLPLTRRFLNNLLLVDSDLIESSDKRKEISRIYSVLLEYLSSQSLAIIECGMFSRFRHILLSSFKVVTDFISFQRLIRALSNTVPFKPLSLKNIMSNGVIKTIQKFVRQNEINMMLRCLNLTNLIPNDNMIVKRNI